MSYKMESISITVYNIHQLSETNTSEKKGKVINEN